MSQIILGECIEVLPSLPNAFAQLVYIDPPFNTGKIQKRDRISVKATNGPGDRGGFCGRRYEVKKVESGSYADDFDDFEGFLMTRIEASLPCIARNGSLFVHLDYREVHYIKLALDRLLGRCRFINEIIWAYGYGGKRRTDGLRSTTASCGTRSAPTTTSSTTTRLTGYRTWLQGSSLRKRLNAAKSPRTSGGTRLFRPMVERKLGILRRNLWAFWSESSKCTAAPVILCSITLRAVERQVRRQLAMGENSCSLTIIRKLRK